MYPFKVLTDHETIKNLKKGKIELPIKCLAHFCAFSFDLKFKQGKEIQVRDTLSCLQIERKSNIHAMIPLIF